MELGTLWYLRSTTFTHSCDISAVIFLYSCHACAVQIQVCMRYYFSFQYTCWYEVIVVRQSLGVFMIYDRRCPLTITVNYCVLHGAELRCWCRRCCPIDTQFINHWCCRQNNKTTTNIENSKHSYKKWVKNVYNST